MIIDKKDAERLAVKARNSISKYCYSECNAYCCRKGYILLNTNEAKLVTGKTQKGLEKLKEIGVLIKTEKGKYVIDLAEKQTGCPSLNESRCIIHDNPKRPAACKEFPLFIWKIDGKDIIHVSERCPAVKEGMLYPYLAKFKMMGFDINYRDDK
jgi:Fe-S-cluster containining protein